MPRSSQLHWTRSRALLLLTALCALLFFYRLDARDFEQELAAKQSVLDKTRYDFEKIERLFEEGSAGKQEVVDALKGFDVAQLEANTAERALDDACSGDRGELPQVKRRYT